MSDITGYNKPASFQYIRHIAKKLLYVVIESMTYPLAFREKVFATKDTFDLTFEATSQQFDMPILTLFRWQRKLTPPPSTTPQQICHKN